MFERLVQGTIKALVDWMEKCVPEYNPSEWNDNNGVQRSNRCYNYACDIKSDGKYAEPGVAHNVPPKRPDSINFECEQLIKAAESDGLALCDCDKGCGGCNDCSHQVALFVRIGTVSPGVGCNPISPNLPDDDDSQMFFPTDYHWIRKDRNGRWSHKRGENPARELSITNPKDLKLGTYYFCACFCVDKTKVSIA